VNDIRAVKSAITATLKDARSASHGKTLAGEGDALVQEASRIEGVLMQGNIKGSEANLNFPGMLNEQIYSFGALLDDADTAPNAQETETYADFHTKLAAQLAAWNALKAAKLPAFCTHARQGGGQPGAALCAS